MRLVELPSRERDALIVDADPYSIMQAGGPEWVACVARVLRVPVAERTAIHPRVRRLLNLLQEAPSDADVSLPVLAAEVGLSPSRLMHAFTESIGLPLRPYLAWLRLQRAAAAIVSGMALTDAALSAGFSDAAHMSRAFRRMFGMAPSALRRR